MSKGKPYEDAISDFAKPKIDDQHPNFARAIDFATEAHKNQRRKGSDVPYIVHPLEAAAIVQTMTDDEEVWVAAVLHDTVEDTPVTQDEIRENFGERVAKLVASDSEDKRENLPPEVSWKIRKEETIDYVTKTPDIAEKMVALGDKLSNMRQMARDYARLGDELWERFNQKDKNEQAWYYRSMLNATKELADYGAWQEYKKLVDEVFGDKD